MTKSYIMLDKVALSKFMWKDIFIAKSMTMMQF
jgi:hypothetical protein